MSTRGRLFVYNRQPLAETHLSARLPTLWLLLVVGCAPQDTRALGDAGPCGRGKARSCQCEDGSKGISQCTRGDDWGECVCNPSELELEPDASFSDNDAGSEGEPAFADCESRFDFRAHAPGDFAAPFRVPARSLLPGSEYQRVCFYFRVPYVFDSVALGFSALLYETPGLRSWMLYGLDKTTHADGEIGACNGAEPGAYLLAAFAPGVSDVRLPDDVGLALPHGSRAGMVLEVQYASGSEELLDRTGVRICGARTSARAHTAAVHFTGSQGICIPPAARNYEVRGSCEPRTDRGPIHVLDVWPSMHQHGRRMQITVNRASGQREPLHDAPFAFDDQQRFPAHDVTLLPGDTLETHCYFDNDSLVPISFGESADEETCFGFITAWPAGSLASNPLGALGSALGIEPDRSCLNPADILLSCTGAADAL